MHISPLIVVFQSLPLRNSMTTQDRILLDPSVTRTITTTLKRLHFFFLCFYHKIAWHEGDESLLSEDWKRSGCTWTYVHIKIYNFVMKVLRMTKSFKIDAMNLLKSMANWNNILWGFHRVQMVRNTTQLWMCFSSFPSNLGGMVVTLKRGSPDN